MLKNFKVDPRRHALTVDVKFYQMNLVSVVEAARQADPQLFAKNGAFLPSWSKFVEDPARAKGFFVNMLQAVFEGKGGHDSLNVELQTRSAPKVSMMFLPGSTKNKNFESIASIAQQALKGYDVVPVYGEETTNRDAEQMVKERIEIAERNGQHVLIISAGMAQRSFSIPQINKLFLAYDAGDNGATIQKMSRALTPHNQDKVGHIISLSFDPNRDDKFDAMLIETAQNYKRNHKIADLKQALRDVIRTVDLFRCQDEGAVRIELDDYLESIIESRSLDRIIGKIAPWDELTADEIKALASGESNVFRNARTEAAQRGKTSLTSLKKESNKTKKDLSLKDLQKAKEMIVTIAQNIDIIYHYGVYNGGSTIEHAFEIMDREGKVIQDDVTEQFGVPYDMIRELVLTNFINRDLLDLKFV